MVKVNDKGDEIVSPENGPSSMEGDGSFVVLERSTLQDYSSQFPNGVHPPSSMSQPRENLSSSYIPASLPDLSPEEIQRKLQEVLQENVELKETLHQNNLAMKQQFNTLLSWQDEVFKVHQSHKEKFQETKELILKLKAENTELKSYLEKCGNSSDTQLKEENAKLKGQIAELQQKLCAPMPRRDLPHGTPTKKEEELSDLVKQLNTQLETAERARRQLTIENESLGARCTRAEREAAELKIALAEQAKKCTSMEQKNSELAQKIQQNELELQSYVMIDKQGGHVKSNELQLVTVELSAARSEIEELKKQVEEDKEIKGQLITRIQQQDKVLQELQKECQLQQQSSAKQVQPTASLNGEEGFSSLLLSCENKLKDLNDILFRQTERYANLEKCLRCTAANVHPWQPSRASDMQNVLNLKLDIEKLMKLLSQEQAFSEEVKTHLTENKSNFQKLFADYQNLLLEWENYSQEQKDKDRHNADYHNVQSKGYSEKLDHLAAQVLCRDEEIKENEKEIRELTVKVKRLELENEAIAILKAQVEVYQSDFNAEREARENLAGEKERLAEDLRHLQRRNQQLLDDLETYQRNQFESIQARNSGGSNSGTIASPGQASANDGVNLAVNSERNQRQSPEVEPSPPRVYDEEIPPPKEYVCPMCKMAFRQLGLLEYHVETCLDNFS